MTRDFGGVAPDLRIDRRRLSIWEEDSGVAFHVSDGYEERRMSVFNEPSNNRRRNLYEVEVTMDKELLQQERSPPVN